MLMDISKNEDPIDPMFLELLREKNIVDKQWKAAENEKNRKELEEFENAWSAAGFVVFDKPAGK
jgi:hypothetical protein